MVGVTVLLLHFVSILGVPLHFVLEPHGVCGDTICHVPAFPDAGPGTPSSTLDDTDDGCGSHGHATDVRDEPSCGPAVDSSVSEGAPWIDRGGRSDSSEPFACGLVDSFQPKQSARVELDPARLGDVVGSVSCSVTRWSLTPKFPLFRLAPKNSPGLES